MYWFSSRIPPGDERLRWKELPALTAGPSPAAEIPLAALACRIRDSASFRSRFDAKALSTRETRIGSSKAAHQRAISIPGCGDGLRNRTGPGIRNRGFNRLIVGADRAAGHCHQDKTSEPAHCMSDDFTRHTDTPYPDSAFCQSITHSARLRSGPGAMPAMPDNIQR